MNESKESTFKNLNFLNLASFAPFNNDISVEADRFLIQTDNRDGGCIAVGAPGHVGDVTWKDDNYISAVFLSHGQYVTNIIFEFWEEGDLHSTPTMQVVSDILPGVKTRLSFSFPVLNNQQLFLMRTPSALKSHVVGKKLVASKISKLVVLFSSAESCKVEISEFAISESEPPYPPSNTKLVDKFGQLTTKSWAGKTDNIEKMAISLKKDLVQGSTPWCSSLWDQYGGLATKKFSATGFFQTHFDGRRWWLVDPDGHPFFSHGVSYPRPGEWAWIGQNRSMYADLPDRNNPDYAEAWATGAVIPEMVKRHGIEAASSIDFFNFGRANLIRAFGSNWWESWASFTTTRLKNWGINTVGIGVNEYEDERSFDFLRRALIPYVITLKHFPTTEQMIFGDFPDVFSDEYERNAKQYADQVIGLAEDPYLLGYFLTNEPEWACLGISPAEELLKKGGKLSSVEHFIHYLSDQYGGNISTLNISWESNFSSFSDLFNGIKALPHTESAIKDIQEFSRILIQQYMDIPLKAVKHHDSNHLILGLRYAGLKNSETFTHHKDCTVFSFNCYKHNPSEAITQMGDIIGSPTIIGEFHFGALDRGLLKGGLQTVSTQEERASAYRLYVEQAASNPWCVGTHYFTHNDQPLLGRFDGESYQIGFTDVCHTSHTEFVDAVRDTAFQLYRFVEKGQLYNK
jgi:hypothetical protein